MVQKTNPIPSAEKVRLDQWDRTHGTYLTGRAAIDGADALAIEMETRWGCDRLRLLVDPVRREKFDRQRYKFNAAICAGSLQDVLRESQRMINAWRDLNNTAIVAGAQPLPREVWEVAMDDGSILAVVPTDAMAHKIIAEGRQVAVFTMEEVARLLALHRTVVEAKLSVPGATVTRVAKNVNDPLEGVEATSLDEPFNDPVPNWGR